jgi:hypothetical protein
MITISARRPIRQPATGLAEGPGAPPIAQADFPNGCYTLA